MNDWTQAIHTYLTQASTSYFRHKDVTILDQWQGRDNLLWRVRTDDGTDAVLKLFTDAGQARSRRQFSGQERFAQEGLAPEPLWYDRYPEGLPRQILVYRWVDGVPIDLSRTDERLALLTAVARIHGSDPAEVQRFSPHPFNLLTFWQVWQVSESQLAGWLATKSVPLLTDLLAALWAAVHEAMALDLPIFGETPPCPVHGEFAAENGLLHRGSVLFVDWEYFGLGDPARELAHFLFYDGADIIDPRQESASMQEDLLSESAHYSPIPHLFERTWLYLRLYTFQAATTLLEGIRQETGHGQVSAAELANYRPFLVESLQAALLRSAEIWGVFRFSATDQQRLLQEIEQLIHIGGYNGSSYS